MINTQYDIYLMITLHTTNTGKKELFVPLHPGRVTLYVCGITPYDYAHIGHGRVYVTFDVLNRLLTFLGYQVSYCRNFTDIDDKIIARATKELGDPHAFLAISKKYTHAFSENMERLGCKVPTYQPCVTTTIPEIITFIEGLLAKNKAYQSGSDVYFSIDSYPEYGALSKHKMSDLIAGARVEVNDKKRNPLDFALWKGVDPQQPGWQSPWGYGRPGWHIECSAMAQKFLGTTIDIHAGGQDLIFPHHENEIAQSQGLHEKQFVRYWLHNGFVRINQEKMSKSLGNFFTLKDVFEKFDPMVVRFYILNHHYRAPLDFSFDDLSTIKKSYQRLCRFFNAATVSVTHDEIEASTTVKKMLSFLCDDLNTPGMWGTLFESLPALAEDIHELSSVKFFIQQVLGISLQPLAQESVAYTPEIEKMIAEREQARLDKDWKKADELRQALRERGVQIQDQKK